MGLNEAGDDAFLQAVKKHTVINLDQLYDQM